MNIQENYIISQEPLGEHDRAVQRFGPEPPGPGWFVEWGFRGHTKLGPKPSGPFDSFGEARREWLLTRTFPSGRRGLTFSTLVALDEQNLRMADTARIDDFVKLECGRGMLIGEYVHVASFCHLGIGGGVTILEDGSSFGSGAKLISGSNLYGPGHGCSAIDPKARVRRSFVHVGRNATIYAGGIVLPGVMVGEGAVVAAGAVVRADVPEYTLVAGNPARVVKELTR